MYPRASTSSKAKESAVNRPVTSIDVARAAGVSQATVSRVLNNRTVSPRTRDAVRKAIERLDYRPNTSARNLVLRKSSVVGVVLGDLLNGYYAEILETVHAQLAGHGYRALIITDTGREPGDLGKLLWDANVDGAIITTSLMSPANEGQVRSRSIPTVSMNRGASVSNDAVAPDNREGGRIAGRHLAELGHRSIGVIAGPMHALSISDRHEGFTSELIAAGVTLDPAMVFAGEMEYQRAYDAALHLLDSDTPPTAIFCHNDLMAFAALNAAASVNIAVPGDLSVLGFDDVAMSSWPRLQLTTVKQPIRDLALAAVDLLLNRFDDPDRAPRTVILPCSLALRSSTDRPRAL
jgi:LacI family transcriptional regulator